MPKPHLYFKNGLWFCTYAKGGLIAFSGKTPREAFYHRLKWLTPPIYEQYGH